MADILATYINSDEFNKEKLLNYAKLMGNSAIYKRMGFLIEQLKFNGDNDIVSACKNNLKSGYSQLDPNINGTRLETRWNLWVPKLFKIKDQE